ncbi:MAG: integrase, partial [Nocardiopsis sp. BM-2018]
MEPVDTTDPDDPAAPRAQLALPAPVRARLEHLDHSVLVDTRALARVRERFDTEQAPTLGRFLT